MKKIVNAKISKIEFLNTNICDMNLICPDIAKEAVPGQFVEIYPDNGVQLLARPISICEILKDSGEIRVVFQIIGKGTELFSQKKAGDILRVLGPCGNGYTLTSGRAVLVGGGIGVPPMLETAKHLKNPVIVLGYRTEPFLTEEFKKYGEVHVCTDDGSVGYHGNTVAFLREKEITADVIYSCGPKIMLKFLSEYAAEKNIPCFVSMEERMACGIGACVGCVIAVKENGKQVYKKVCKDGPVFDSKEVVW